MNILKHKAALMLGATLAAGMVCGGAWADPAPVAETSAATDADTDSSNGVETVVVSGTRIPQAVTKVDTPVQSVSVEELKKNGVTNLTDYLVQIPALISSETQADTAGYSTPANDTGYSMAGLNVLDLRNLGSARTLTLVNGHRQVSSSTGDGSVDINTIPTSLIDHVDVLTGGFSAIYGADAVSGVVNFVMKKNFSGFSGNVQTGMSQNGGGDTLNGSVAYGYNTDDGRGNITVAVDYSSQGRLGYKSRSFTREGGYTALTYSADEDSKYTLSPTKQARFIWSSRTGAITSDIYNLDYPDYTGDGGAYDVGTAVSASTSIGGSGMPYATDVHGDLLPSTHDLIFDSTGHYTVNRYADLQFDVKYAHTYADSWGTAPFDDYVVIQADNAFLPENVATAIADGDAGYGILSEDYLALRRRERTSRDTFSINVQSSGELPNVPHVAEDLAYNLSFTIGRTNVRDTDVGNRIEDRFFAALDSVIDPDTGEATCRSNLDASAVPGTLDDLGLDGYFSDTSNLTEDQFGSTFTPGEDSGCIAFNPFDPDRNDQKAAIDWITRNTTTRSHLYQKVFTGSVSGTIPAARRVFAGPLAFAMGGEYRFEKANGYGDPNARDGLTFDQAPSNVSGSFDVGEVFGEAKLPLIKNVPFIYDLRIDAAVRYSHYSSGIKSTTWQYGGSWMPLSWLTLRASNAYAVRAPNIGELYGPQTTSYSSISDPCDAANVDNGTSYRRDNCIAIMENLGVSYNPDSTSLDTGSTTETISSGNDELKPEKARTFTAGFMVQPKSLIPNLMFQADWYRIQINDAIESMAASDIAEECVDSASIDNQYCDLITRYSSGIYAGMIEQASSTEVNVAYYETSGVDYSLMYFFDTAQQLGQDYGSFMFKLNGGYLNSLRYIDLPGDEVEIDTATKYAPKHTVSAMLDWSFEKFQISYSVSWWSSTFRYSRNTRRNNPDYVARKYWKYPERFVNNVRFGYTTDNDYNFYAGVNNIFNQQPGLGSSSYPVSPLGRYFYMGVSLSTDGGLPSLPRF